MGCKTAKDYDGQVFYKISKSCLDVAKCCYESHFIEYIPNSIIRDEGEHFLCYAPGETIIGCIPYGDQLTEIVFDSRNPLFEQIADEEICYVGGGFGEYRSRAVLTGQSYMLSEPATIQRIINMTPKNRMSIIAKVDRNLGPFSIANHLEKLGFTKSLDFWNMYIERL